MDQTKTLPTVDVGIPALNEAANIQRILKLVAGQQTPGFRIGKIILLSDGSTDDTVKLAKSLHLPNLKIIENPSRKGLPTAWHKLFRASRADILVLFDADIALEHDHVVANLLRPMFADKNITLTSGRPVKQSTHAFADKVMDVSMALQDYVKAHAHGGRSVYGCHGRIVAVRRSIFSQIEPPKHTLGNDAFLYFFNKSHGGDFEYVPDATIAFKMPQAYADFSKQSARFARAKHDLAAILGDWIYEEYEIPRHVTLGALLQTFARKPFYSFCYVLFRVRARIGAAKHHTFKVNDWETTTTKSLD
jgi:glycosyltransferase involved in cell wall biosynthesis